MLVDAPFADVGDELARVGPGGRGIALQLGLERFDAVVVGDDVEGVVVPEVIEDELEGVLGLVELLAGHRARAVEHEEDRLGQRPGVERLDLGAGQQEEIAVLVRVRPVAQDGRAEGPVGQGVDQLEVIGRQDVAAVERGLGLALAAPGDGHVVARAIDRLDRVFPLDPEVERQPLDRLARMLLGRERIDELDDVAVLLADLGIAEGDLAVGPRRESGRRWRGTGLGPCIRARPGRAWSGRSPRRSAGPRPWAGPGRAAPCRRPSGRGPGPPRRRAGGRGIRPRSTVEPGLWNVWATRTSATWSRTLASIETSRIS